MMPVIQPSVPISVVASGIMIRIMKNMNGRPSDLVYTPKAIDQSGAERDEAQT